MQRLRDLHCIVVEFKHMSRLPQVPKVKRVAIVGGRAVAHPGCHEKSTPGIIRQRLTHMYLLLWKKAASKAMRPHVW